MVSSKNGERFGSPQAIAALLLLIFLGQCLWFCARAPLSDRELAVVMQGQQQWRHSSEVLRDPPSPITALIAALPVLRSSATSDYISPYWRWFTRLPFMIMAVLFGASLWYVARRLYGNTAGYIALLLYAFSPMALIRSATVQPNLIADWGAFGAIFTAIGLAHTLYAPREVVLWNWKRILLLGLALGLASGAQFAVVVLIPVALAFMWYLAPERRGAAMVIMLAGCVIGLAILLAAYGFNFGALLEGIRGSHLTVLRLSALSNPITYTMLGIFLLRQPTSLLLLLIAIVTFAVWKRTRFFGTAAPLIVFSILILLGIAMPFQGGMAFYIMALPFSYVFISGVMVDLLESKISPVALGVVMGVLLGHIGMNLIWLTRM
jgi:hypothetical protein